MPGITHVFADSDHDYRSLAWLHGVGAYRRRPPAEAGAEAALLCAARTAPCNAELWSGTVALWQASLDYNGMWTNSVNLGHLTAMRSRYG